MFFTRYFGKSREDEVKLRWDFGEDGRKLTKLRRPSMAPGAYVNFIASVWRSGQTGL